MATGKVLGAANSSFSFSGGFKSIFSCCFATSTPTPTRAREAANQQNEESPDESLDLKGSQGPDDKADRGAKAGGGEEALNRSRGIGLNPPSDRDSTVYDEFCDSAIDSSSLTSQFNLRGSVDGETMKMSDPDERNSRHGNQNDDISEQYVTRFEQESNYDDAAISATAPIFVTGAEAVRGEGDESVVMERDADDNSPPAAETELDQLDPMSGQLEDDATAVADANADLAHPAVIQCGQVRMTLAYDSGRQRLTVTVHEASDIPDHDRVNLSHSEVHLLLLPASRKIRHKTKAKTGENPQFEDTFRAKISSDELEGSGFRLRLYGSEKFKKEVMIGENYVSFSSIPFDQGAPHSSWVVLHPRININVIGDSASAGADEMDIDFAEGTTASSSPAAPHQAVSSSSGPSLELMLGMAYNATTGRLSVEVVQGCNIKSPDSQKPPDTYVKLRLIAPNGQEITRCKTTVRRSQPNPLYKETFMFHVPQFQLPDVSLMVSVFEHRNLKHNKMLGWLTLGHTNSTEETKIHWMAMIESKGEQIARWQTLLSP